jgi:hypothetical protein
MALPLPGRWLDVRHDLREPIGEDLAFTLFGHSYQTMSQIGIPGDDVLIGGAG